MTERLTLKELAGIDRNVYKSLDFSDERMLRAGCYHLQQYAEKIVKYYIELKGLEYPKIHDLRKLLIIADDRDLISIFGGKEDMITDYEAITRYDSIFVTTIKQCEEVLEICDKLYDFVDDYEKKVFNNIENSTKEFN